MPETIHPSDAAPEKRTTGGAQAVDRALELLEIIGREDGPISLPALCERTGLNRSTVWRLLSTLERHHFISRNPRTRDYELGYGATLLSTAPQRRYAALIRCAQPAMEQLRQRTSESVLLSVPHPGGTLMIYQLDSPLSIRLKNYVNHVTPYWCTSNGKVALTRLMPQELEQLLQQQPPSFSARPVEDLEAVRAEIRRTAQQGYGMVEGDWSTEENAISAPILTNGELAAFLSIGGPSTRFTRQDMEAVAPQLLSACAEIGAALL